MKEKYLDTSALHANEDKDEESLEIVGPGLGCTFPDSNSNIYDIFTTFMTQSTPNKWSKETMFLINEVLTVVFLLI